MIFAINLFRPDANVPEIARNVLAWVVDLETTTAKQGHRHLRYNDEYCCLGRGCEVLGIERDELPSGVVKYGGAIGFMPDDAVVSFGLNGSLGQFFTLIISEKQVDCLTDLNDWLEWTFPEIALFIRDSWEHQFGKPLEVSA